jgi:hypothetical protein
MTQITAQSVLACLIRGSACGLGAMLMLGSYLRRPTGPPPVLYPNGGPCCAISFYGLPPGNSRARLPPAIAAPATLAALVAPFATRLAIRNKLTSPAPPAPTLKIVDLYTRGAGPICPRS